MKKFTQLRESITIDNEDIEDYLLPIIDMGFKIKEYNPSHGGILFVSYPLTSWIFQVAPYKENDSYVSKLLYLEKEGFKPFEENSAMKEIVESLYSAKKRLETKKVDLFYEFYFSGNVNSFSNSPRKISVNIILVDKNKVFSKEMSGGFTILSEYICEELERSNIVYSTKWDHNELEIIIHRPGDAIESAIDKILDSLNLDIPDKTLLDVKKIKKGSNLSILIQKSK